MQLHVINFRLVITCICIVSLCLLALNKPEFVKRLFRMNLTAKNSLGNVITKNDNGWTINNKVCQRSDDFVLSYLKTPPNTPIYVYSEKVDEYVSKDIIETGSYEPYNVDKLINYLKQYPKAVFIDLGANVGAFSITIAALGYTVIAVECLPSTVMRLCASMHDAKVTDKLTIVNNAVSDMRYTVDLETEPGNMGLTYLAYWRSGGKVQTILLDDLLEVFDLKQVVMKMDVEMSEDEILRGANKFFKRVRVEALLMEFIHHQNNPNGDDAKFIINFLASNDLEPDVPDDIKGDYKKWKSNEILFKRKQ